MPEPSQSGITQEYTETIHVRRFYLDSVAIDALLSRALKAGLCSLPGGPVEDLDDVDVTVSTDGERVSAIVKVTGKTRSS